MRIIYVNKKYCFYSYNLVEKIIWRIPCDISRNFFWILKSRVYFLYISHLLNNSIIGFYIFTSFVFLNCWILHFSFSGRDFTFSHHLYFWTVGFFIFPSQAVAIYHAMPFSVILKLWKSSFFLEASLIFEKCIATQNKSLIVWTIEKSYVIWGLKKLLYIHICMNSLFRDLYIVNL